MNRQPLPTLDVCPVCGSAGVGLQLADVADYITGEPFGLARCDDCGIGFTQPHPASVDAYYPARYRRYSSWVLAVLRFFYRRRVSGWVRPFPSPGRALEVGCGDGLMLDALRGLGWEVVGTERNEAVAAVAREKGLRVHTGEPGDLPADAGYDLIIVFQVLEHVHDPVGLLRECARRLRPGGHLVIGVPNLASWQANATGADWVHLDMPRHLTHFTPATLEAVLGRVGLRVRDASASSWEHDPFGWAQSMISRCSPRRNHLLRLLQRLDRPGAGDVVLPIVLVLIGPLCVAASVVSWIGGRGAMMEVVAVGAAEGDR